MTHLAFVWANLRRRPFQNFLGVACATLVFTFHGLAFGMLESFRRASIQNDTFDQQFQRGALLVSALGIVLILALTASATAHAVRQRLHEFGVLKALGFSHGRIIALVVAEAAVPCCAGALLGLLVAPLLFDVLAACLPPLAAWPPPVYTFTLLVATSAMAILVPLLGSVFPVLRLVGLDTAAALTGSARAQAAEFREIDGARRREVATRASAATGAQPAPAATIRLDALRQLPVIVLLGVASLRHRIRAALLITGSVGFAVFALMYLLSMAQGIRTAILGSGDPARVVLRAASTTWLHASRLPDGIAAVAASAPGVARASDGAPLAEAVMYRTQRQFVERNLGSGKSGGGPTIIGVGPHWAEMTPSFRLLQGRLPRPGARELLVGQLVDRFIDDRDRNAGMTVSRDLDAKYRELAWKVVGIFATGDWWDGYLVADRAVVKSLSKTSADSAVLVKLESPDAFEAFRSALIDRLPPSVTVERETDFYASFWASLPKSVLYVAVLLGGLLGLAVIAATTQSVHLALEERRREIATLRVLGFDGRAVVASVVLEAVLLAALGAAMGTALMWLWRDGLLYVGAWSIWEITVDLQLLLLSIGWAALVGVAGALPLALRTIRQTEMETLQELREVHVNRVASAPGEDHRSGSDFLFSVT